MSQISKVCCRVHGYNLNSTQKGTDHADMDRVYSVGVLVGIGLPENLSTLDKTSTMDTEHEFESRACNSQGVGP